MPCSRTQHGDACGVRTQDLKIRSPTLYHYATALPNDDCECGCNENGDDNNGLVQFHILVSSKLSIVSLKVFTVAV